jgi:hypothetical protein
MDRLPKGTGLPIFYDEHYAPPPDDHPMIETLARLTGGGCALELGIGSRRVALPLISRGVTVHGIDASWLTG